jgi:hypothetical protein
VTSGFHHDADENCAHLVITQRWVVILYRHFGTTYWSHLQESRSPRKSPRRVLFLDLLTDTLSRNVGKGLPLDAALYPRRPQFTIVPQSKLLKQLQKLATWLQMLSFVKNNIQQHLSLVEMHAYPLFSTFITHRVVTCRWKGKCTDCTMLVHFIPHSTNEISYLTQMSILANYIFVSAMYLVFHTSRERLFIANIFRVSTELVQFIWKHLDSLCLTTDINVKIISWYCVEMRGKS